MNNTAIITSAQTLQTVTVRSGGRALIVAAADALISGWPQVAPHVPGASATVRACRPSRVSVNVPADLAEARRLINAHLHVLHLGYDTLAVHSVALYRPGSGAVVLLGGHGAGKTLTGTALGLRGWRWLSGDVTLLDIDRTGGAVVRGGTGAIIARRTALRRWFPGLAVPEAGPGLLDLYGWPAFVGAGTSPIVGRVAAAALIDVTGDLGGDVGDEVQLLEPHTAESVWWTGSGHLVDRVRAEPGALPLRALEGERELLRRARLVRTVARDLPMHLLRGSPHRIAEQVERLAGRT
ncbi:hypothetical protein SAMN05421505_1607 [Sinosporangium album]|uniref:Hpr(Ser) kinase/phosphatase n=1 Tax=Sinosporangium album TaxID=504805 RepID=A0A1G8L2G2_9ACTN|nr:hypothetical protein [Sinosporangium album]SDI49855.1 hypothetical protein SAMN05421505_1607 [Sinosporangium album]